MSGPWQHNIPQSLLRGFRIRGGTKKTSQVWLFQKGCEPTLAFVKNVAAADNFYSIPTVDGSKTLDDQITDYEQTSFARALHYLKDAQADSIVDASSAAEVVAHLTIRNDHLRQTFGEASQKLFADAIDVFCNETHVRPLLGIDDKAPPTRFTNAVDEFLSEHPELSNIPVPRHVLHRIAHMMTREWFNRSFLECAPLMLGVLTALITQAPEFVRAGHNKALTSGLAPGPRAELLRQFSWTVRAAGTEGFVLPDCVAVGLEVEKQLQPLMMAGLAESSLILMPLSSRKMLVGTRTAKDEPDLAAFNRVASSCSHQFFIAATKDFAELAANIGTASHHFMEEAVGTLIKQYKSDGRSETSLVPTDWANTDVDDGAPPAAPQYSICFRDCADQATAERIAANVFAVTSEMCRMMPLDKLDGVTFAYDYSAALRDLDRGFASSPLEPTEEEFGAGVAMAPMVIRDGVRKTHIVIRGEMGHYLIGDDDSNRRLALQTIVQQLARAACSQILEETLPEAKVEDHFEAFLYQCADSAWRDYFSSRVGGYLNPEIGDGYCEMAAAVIRRAHRDLVAARVDYQSTNDMNKLMEVALLRVHDILRFSAAVLGHYDGLGKPLLENQPVLETALTKAGLRDWFILFDGELSELWNRRGEWLSFDEFLVLNRHVERLLWHHGLLENRRWADSR